MEEDSSVGISAPMWLLQVARLDLSSYPSLTARVQTAEYGNPLGTVPNHSGFQVEFQSKRPFPSKEGHMLAKPVGFLRTTGLSEKAKCGKQSPEL